MDIDDEDPFSYTPLVKTRKKVATQQPKQTHFPELNCSQRVKLRFTQSQVCPIKSPCKRKSNTLESFRRITTPQAKRKGELKKE